MALAPAPEAGDPGRAIRDAATVILWRPGPRCPEVLMGKRGARAAFMPDLFVFPGGAIDAADATVPLAATPAPACLRRLGAETPPGRVPALLAGAIRELWEETGLILGRPGAWTDPPPGWDGFAARGMRPDAGPLVHVFRAVTPPGRPRRFDARFFLVPVSAVQGDTEGFAGASDELSALQWIALDRLERFALPFITQVVLAELGPLIGRGTVPDRVAFVVNDDLSSGVRWLV